MKRSGVKTPIKATKQTKSIRKVVPPKDVSETEESVDEEEEVVEKKVVKKQGLKKGVKVVPPKNVAESEESIDEEEEVVEKKVAKKQGLKKGAKVVPPKNVAESEESIEEEEVVLKKKVAKKQGLKKGAKTKTRVESKVVEEDDDDEGDNQEEDDEEEEVLEEKVVKKHGLKKGTKAKTRVESKVVEEDDGEEDDDDEGDNQEDDDEEEDNQEDDEDDVESDEEEQVDEGDEAEEDKELATDDKNDEDEDFDMKAYLEECKDERSSPSEILSGPLRFDYHPQQCVHVTNLPKKCKKIDIVEAFAKYGTIKQIHIVNKPHTTFADIAYQSFKAAAEAKADAEEIKVGGSVVRVAEMREGKVPKNQENRDRSICIKNIREDISGQQLRELFEPCGKIESVKVMSSKIGTLPTAFVTFTNKTSVPEALKLHNTVFNDVNIKVFGNSDKREPKQYNEDTTIMLRNKQDFKSIDTTKIESIFSKCGEIEHIEVICKKQVLCFITFKTEEAAKKAIDLSGETQLDIMLEIEPYSRFKKLTAIHIINVPKGCGEEGLRAHFAKAGKISHVNMKGPFAVMRFENSDGYCKSFLYNESFLRGQMIFVEPFSKRKLKVLKNNNNNYKKNIKRSIGNGNSAPKAKRFKTRENCFY